MSKEDIERLLNEAHEKDMLERQLRRRPMVEDGDGNGIASLQQKVGRYRSDSLSSTTSTLCSTPSIIGLTSDSTSVGSVVSSRGGGGSGCNVVWERNVYPLNMKKNADTRLKSERTTDIDLLDNFDIDLSIVDINLDDIYDELFARSNDELGYTLKDVLLGQGGFTNKHPGNVRFRTLADGLRAEYQAKTTSRSVKRAIQQRLIFLTEQNGAKFKQKTKSGTYAVVTKQIVLNKTSQVLREGPIVGLAKRKRIKANKSGGT